MRRILLAQMCLLVLGVLPAVAQDSAGRKVEDPSANCTKERADMIRQAGERLGTPVRTDTMVQLAEGASLSFIAPAANLETSPATELRRGVNIGVAYLDSSRGRVPTGYYRLRALADVRRVGTLRGRIQLLDAGGRVAAELTATVEVQSLTLPRQSKNRSTEITVRTGPIEPSGLRVVYWCVRCPNGYFVCWEYETA